MNLFVHPCGHDGPCGAFPECRHMFECGEQADAGDMASFHRLHLAMWELDVNAGGSPIRTPGTKVILPAPAVGEIRYYHRGPTQMETGVLGHPDPERAP